MMRMLATSAPVLTTVRRCGGSTRAKVPAGAGCSSPSTTIAASPERTTKTSSWSRSVSSCSGMRSPGSISTTFIPKDLSPMERRASDHFPDRSRSSRCLTVKPLSSVTARLYAIGRGCAPETAPARSLDRHRLPGGEGARGLGGKRLPVQEVPSGGPRLPAPGAPGAARPPLAHDRDPAGLESRDLADDAVPAVAPAAAAGAEPERVALDAQRVGELERFHRRVEGVRHGHVHPRGAVRVGAGALPAADRLVVGEARGPEREVVHRPLPLSGNGKGLREGAEEDVRDPAGGLDVAGHDGGRRARVHERALGGADGHGSERAAG